MSAHTPGPWAVDGHFVVRGDGTALCDVWASRPIPNAEAEANARLIASAPDLLEALEALVWDRDVRDVATHHDIGRARAAIAKAKGE